MIDTGATITLIGGDLAQDFNHNFVKKTKNNESFSGANGNKFDGYSHSFRLEILAYEDIDKQDEAIYDTGQEIIWHCTVPVKRKGFLGLHIVWHKIQSFFCYTLHIYNEVLAPLKLQIGLNKLDGKLKPKYDIIIGWDILKDIDLAFFPQLAKFTLSKPCKTLYHTTTTTTKLAKHNKL